MSRTGKRPIEIPEGVQVKIEGNTAFVTGPKGKLEADFRPEIDVKIEDGEILVSEKRRTKKSKAFWGTTRSIIANMAHGVSCGYTVDLQIKGVGYRAEVQGDTLVLRVGFSHTVEIKAPDEISFSVNKDIITVSGIKKDLVGRIAAQVRSVRPPEPYKGKGIRYKDEVVVLKEGKKGAGN